MILIFTDYFDKHADTVINILKAKNIEYFRLNLDVSSLERTFIEFRKKSWKIKALDKQISLDEVSCVWMRRAFVELTLEETLDNSNDFKIWRGEWNKTLQGLFLYLKDIPWLNKINNAYRAENKYLQYLIASEIGFSLPEFIVTNDKNSLLDFSEKYNEVVLKLMSQDFYPTDEGVFKGIYVNQVSKNDLKDFESSNENPIVLQEYIKKDYEVRYTVVGENHFVCKIDSQKSKKASIDWRRYDIINTPHLAIKPPENIVKKVNLLMEKLELNYGALDFIVDPNGEWFFLEVNSMGQWLWIEDLTSLSISNEIANWLIDHIN